ncbi:hypothetical protein KEM52_001777 [Ascosphaera acerosa]|nr:hypothetical protein KEM52_001777 [Ascosphaera acerosa]
MKPPETRADSGYGVGGPARPADHHNASHTSLLIEYFESGKKGPAGSKGRPTVRVSPSRGGTLTATTTTTTTGTGTGTAATSATGSTAPVAAGAAVAPSAATPAIATATATASNSTAPKSDRPSNVNKTTTTAGATTATVRPSQYPSRSMRSQPLASSIPNTNQSQSATTISPHQRGKTNLSRRYSSSSSSSSARSVSSSEDVDPIAARAGKRAAPPAHLAATAASSAVSGSVLPASGIAVAGSVTTTASTSTGLAQSRQGPFPNPISRRYTQDVQLHHPSPHSKQPPQQPQRQPSLLQRRQTAGAVATTSSATPRPPYDYRAAHYYSDEDDDERPDTTDMDATPSDVSSMPDDSLLNGENEDTLGHGKRREKVLEPPYGLLDDEEEDDDEEDELGYDEGRGLHGGGSTELGRHANRLNVVKPSGKARSTSQERIVAKAAEQLNEERRRQRAAAATHMQAQTRPGRRRSADPSPNLPPGVLSQLSSNISSTYPNAQSLATSATSSTAGNQKGRDATAAAAAAANTNPQLLETVENVIRRLILPELAELKNNQKVQANRGLFEAKIAQSDRLANVSESVKDEALRKLLAKHKSAPDVIITSKDPPERQREVSDGSTVKADPGVGRVVSFPPWQAQPQQSEHTTAPDRLVQVPKIVVPDSRSPPTTLEENILPRRRPHHNAIEDGRTAHTSHGDETAAQVERLRGGAAPSPQISQPQSRPQSQRSATRAQSQLSLRSAKSAGSSSTSSGAEIPERRKSKSLRAAESKGLVSSVVRNLDRSRPSTGTGGEGPSFGEGEGKSVVADGTKTELVFKRAGVPEMPFKSAIGSDITRSSILSSRSSDGDDDDDDDDGQDDEDANEGEHGVRGSVGHESRGNLAMADSARQSASQSQPGQIGSARPESSNGRSQTSIKPIYQPAVMRNASEQSTTSYTPGLDSSRLTTSFTDASTSHLPSATASELPSTLYQTSSRNINSILGSQDVQPPTNTYLTQTDDSALSSSSHRPSDRSVEDDLVEATGRHVEHLNAEHRVLNVVQRPTLGVESNVASLVSADPTMRGIGSTVSGVTGLSQAPAASALTSTNLSSPRGVPTSAGMRTSYNRLNVGSPVQEESHDGSSKSLSHASRAPSRQAGSYHRSAGPGSRPQSADSSSSSSSASSASSPTSSRASPRRPYQGHEDTGVATEPDTSGFGVALQREADLGQHQSVPSELFAAGTDAREDHRNDAYSGGNNMPGARDSNDSPFPFARPSPGHGYDQAMATRSPMQQGHEGRQYHQMTVSDDDDVETNPSVINGHASNLPVSPGQLETPREALLPEPLAPGGGSGSLRYNPDFMQSQEDYGEVLRAEAVSAPREVTPREVTIRPVTEQLSQEPQSAPKAGAATAAGVSAALATAALAAGLDPNKMGKGQIGFEQGVPEMRDTDTSLPTGYHDTRHFSASSASTNNPICAASKAFENIENKDIMALMQHLTVRDAQRNARDTEILFTLVRSAADMRNSFEEMKRFIAQQDEIIMDNNEKQHLATQRAINGPRPPPSNFTRRDTGALGQQDDDTKAKKKNVFRRAMRGLSGKSSNELTKIEDMLYHLLNEVEQLRMAQHQQLAAGSHATQQQNLAHTRTVSGMDVPLRLSTNDKRHSMPESEMSALAEDMIPIRLVTSREQPAGNAQERPKSWTAAQPIDQAAMLIDGGLQSHQPHRVSPIHEADERSMQTAERENSRRNSAQQHISDDEPLTADEQRYLDKTRVIDENSLVQNNRAPTGLIASPRVSYENEPMQSSNANDAQQPTESGPDSSEHDTSQDTKRRGFFKKFKKGFVRKERTQTEPPETPGVETGQVIADSAQTTGQRGASDSQEESNARLAVNDRPPSPLIPSEVSGISQVSEPPKFRVHRDGTHLLHPRPRPYATEAHKNQLETEAQHFIVQSPRLGDWASISTASHRKNSDASHLTTVHRRNPSDPFSPATASEAGTISIISQAQRPRRAREKDDGPLVPERANAGPETGKRDYSTYTQGSRAAGRRGSGTTHSVATMTPPPAVAAAAAGGSHRKLTGPRPLTSTGSRSSHHQQQKQQQHQPPPRPWSRSPELVEGQ